MDVFDLIATLKLDSSDYVNGLSDAQKETQSLSTSLKSAIKPLAKVGAAGIATGTTLFAYANKTAQTADNIDKMSQKLGLSAQAYQEWDYVMQISGTDIDSMTAGIKTLTNKYDAAISGTESAVEMFNKLGLSVEDIQNLSREDLFATVIEQFQGMEDNAERAALANDLLGRSGSQLAPLFNTTSEETKDLIQNLHDMGGIMSDDAVKNGAAFQDSLTSMKTAFAGAANSLGSELVPEITKLVDKVTEFVKSGGLKKMLDTFKKLAPAIAGVTTALVAYKTAMGIASLVTALTKATEGMTIAQALLNAVMNANPFVLVATLIAGLVAAIVTLWHTNDDFRNAIKEIFSDIADFFTNLFDKFVEMIGYIPGFLKETWDNITDTLADVFGAIAEFFDEFWENVKNIFSEAIDGIKSTVSEKFNAVKEKIAEIWEGIKNKISEIIETIKTSVSDKFTEIKEKIKSIWNTIKSVVTNKITNIKDTITEGVQGAIDFLKDLPAQALQWGKDLIANFVQGIKDKVNDVVDAVKDVADTVKDFIGFSEPEKGPLSKFHTFAPDMIDLFANGIKDGLGNVENASSAMASAINPKMPAFSGIPVSAENGYADQGIGDIIIPVYIGQARLDELIVTGEQLRNYRSGGR